MIQISGMTGPIAVESVFVGGLPFVIFCFIGILDKSKEAREEFEYLVKNKQANLTSLQNLIKKYPAKSQNNQINIDPKNNKGRNLLNQSLSLRDNIIHNFNDLSGEQQREDFLKSEKFLSELKELDRQSAEITFDKKAAPYGNYSLGGMRPLLWHLVLHGELQKFPFVLSDF